MKKGMMRVLVTAIVVIAMIFIVVLLITAFGGLQGKDFDNSLVKTLFVSLAIVFALISAGVLYIVYANEDLVKEVVLKSDTTGSTRTTLAVIKKITKQTVMLVPGVKLKKCTIFENDYGVRLKVGVKVKENDIGELERELRALLDDAFYGALGYKFTYIDFRVSNLESKHQVNAPAIVKKVKEEIKAEEEAKKAEEANAQLEETVKEVTGNEQVVTEVQAENNDSVVAEEANAELQNAALIESDSLKDELLSEKDIVSEEKKDEE